MRILLALLLFPVLALADGFPPPAVNVNGQNIAPASVTTGSNTLGTDLAFTPSGSNPTLTNGAEADMVMSGTTCYQWYRLVSGTTVYRRSATNALLDNWTSGTACTGMNGALPHTFQVGSTYYCFIKIAGISNGDIYLYSSTDGLAWSAMNSGNPVLTRSATATNWTKDLFNVGVAIVGSEWHLVVEGYATSGTYSGLQQLGYTHGNLADLTTFQTNLTSIPIIRNANAPELIYDSSHNALILLYAHTSPNNASAFKVYLQAAVASLADDLTSSGSWRTSSLTFENLNTSNAGNSDPSLVFTSGKTYGSLLYYNYNQATGYQAYGNVSSASDLYNKITNLDFAKHAPQVQNLGIGTAALAHVPLQVVGTDASNGYIAELFNPNATYPQLHFGFSGSNCLYMEWQTGGQIFGTLPSDSKPFTFRGSGVTFNPAVTFGSTLNGNTLIAGSGTLNLGTSTLTVTASGTFNGVAALPLTGGTLTGNVAFSPRDTYNIGTPGVSEPHNIDVANNITAGGKLVSYEVTAPSGNNTLIIHGQGTGGVNFTSFFTATSGTFSKDVLISGTLILSGTYAAPTNAVTPAAWGLVQAPSGTAYKIPLYQ